MVSDPARHAVEKIMATNIPAVSRRRKTIAGRYRLISKLGEGGMGTVHRAWDVQTGVPVVIKMPKKSLLDTPLVAKRFAREVLTMAAVPHPHIVTIVDHGEDAGGEFVWVPFAVMRFLPGGSLSQRRLRDSAGRPLPNHPSTLHLWLPGIASALDAVHAAGIVHRDVKPGNIFFDGFWHAFLGDFGIAKLLRDIDGEGGAADPLTGTHVGVGTPEYMSPEQFSPRAVVDGRSDQYALAVMIYELLSGSTPFMGKTTHFAVEHLTKQPPPLGDRSPGLPPRLCSAVHWALAKNPADRFESCSEFAATVLADVKPMTAEHDVVRLLCPACSNILKLPLTAGGRAGKCPRCQTVMNVAQDLGSLWLRGEDQEEEQDFPSTPASGSVATLTPVSGTTKARPVTRRTKWPTIDPFVFRIGLVAWASFLFISYLLAILFNQSNHQSHEVQKLLAEKAEIEGERQELLMENERLKAELTRVQSAAAQADEDSLPSEQQRTAREQPETEPATLP